MKYIKSYFFSTNEQQGLPRDISSGMTAESLSKLLLIRTIESEYTDYPWSGYYYKLINKANLKDLKAATGL